MLTFVWEIRPSFAKEVRMSDPQPHTISPGSHPPTPESEHPREDPDAVSDRICNSNPTAHFGAREDRISPPATNLEICKSNPTAHPGAPDESTTPSASNIEICNSNPTAHSGARQPLSPRKLAALRLLARGHGSQRVADHLGVNRHTIARWKREPAFAAELERRVAALTESALRLRAGSRMHAFSLYRAELARHEK
jgi:hypothetical protein